MRNQEKNPPVFQGAATALITPFRDGAPDFEALGRLIDRQIVCGIDALVLLGTTGENATLSEKEREDVVRFSLSRIDGRVPAIVGVGSPDTSAAVRYTRFAAKAGADAVLAVTPYYNKGTSRGIREYYRLLAEEGVPVIVYHVPSRTGVSLSVEDYVALAEIPGIVGIKEAGGDLARAAHTMEAVGEKITLYSGNDSETLPFLSLGACGVISVLSNLFPGEVHTLCHRWFEGDVKGSGEVFYRFLPLSRLLFAETNPTPVKCAASLMGLCLPDVRLPLTAATATTAKLLSCELARLGAENPHSRKS